MFRKMPWYDWLGVLVMIGLFGQGVARLAMSGYSTGTFLRIIIIPLLLAAFFWGRRRAGGRRADGGPVGEDKPLVSIVLLMREHRYLDEAMLKRLVRKAWGIDIPDEDDEAYIIGRPPVYVIQVPEGAFLVHNHQRPYMDNPEAAAAEMSELRLRRVITEHQAWRAVDLLHPGAGAGSQGRAYELIGKLVAELSDDATLAVYAPETDRMVAWDSDFEDLLRGKEPLKVFGLGPPPVVEVTADDPRMTAAVAEARRRWPEFVAAFERRTPDQHFTVKAPMGDGARKEFIWVEVTALEGDRIIGELANDPVNLPGLRCGDKVTARVEDLNDWIYMKNGDMVGGFTVKVLMGRKGK